MAQRKYDGCLVLRAHTFLHQTDSLVTTVYIVQIVQKSSCIFKNMDNKINDENILQFLKKADDGMEYYSEEVNVLSFRCE